MQLEDISFDMLDKDKFVEWLMGIHANLIHNAHTQKQHVAVQSYAKAAMLEYVTQCVMQGEFDIDNSDRVLN